MPLSVLRNVYEQSDNGSWQTLAADGTVLVQRAGIERFQIFFYAAQRLIEGRKEIGERCAGYGLGAEGVDLFS